MANSKSTDERKSTAVVSADDWLKPYSFANSQTFENFRNHIATSSFNRFRQHYEKLSFSALDALSIPLVPTLIQDWTKLPNQELFNSIKSLDINIHFPSPSRLSFSTVSSTSTDQIDVIDSSVDLLFDSETTGTSFENKINARRLLRFKAEFSKNLLSLLREQDFEYGFYSPADKIVHQCLLENEIVTKQWLNELFIKNFNDVVITVGLVRVISHIDYEVIAPQGMTMALAALSHKNNEVKECGIRAFENWGSRDSLTVLENISFDQKWLQDYLEQVIEDLTVELSR